MGKKDELLGVSFGAACNKLRKNILFRLVQRLNEDICYRCGQKILSVDSLSIEHKEPWESSLDPIATFFDLDNISFSHIKCNYGAARTIPYSKSKYSSAKLSDKLVIELRNDAKRGIKTKVLAEKYSITSRNVRYIKSKYTWKS